VAHDPNFEGQIVAEPDVPGIDRVNGDEVEYLLLVKTTPGKHYAVSRELRRRIKSCFERQGIQPGNPNRVYVVDTRRAV
jgi:small conductance mechanosensitive channel